MPNWLKFNGNQIMKSIFDQGVLIFEETTNSRGNTMMLNRSPVSVACLVLIISIVSSMHVFASDGDDLFKAVRFGKIEQTRTLIEKGVDTNILNAQGRTPLIMAALANNLRIARLLIDKGAKLDVADKMSQRTALLHSVGLGHLDMVKLLIEKGANLKAVDKRKMNALMIAVRYEEIVSFLLGKGVDPDGGKDVDGWTPLFYAASSGHLQSAELLINAGAEIDAKDKLGWTPLMYAIDFKQLETAKFLINEGIILDQTDSEGQTALMYAAKGGHGEIVKLLLEKKVNTTLKDIFGKTALDKAKKKGHREIVELLTKIKAPQ